MKQPRELFGWIVLAGLILAGPALAVEVSIDDIQYYDPLTGGTSSPYASQSVTVTGVVTVVKGTLTSGGYYLQDSTGGINYYAPDATGINTGDIIRVTATVFYDQGEIYLHDTSSGTALEVLGNGPAPQPMAFDIGDLTADYENVGWFVSVVGTASDVSSSGMTLTLDGHPVLVHVSSLSGIDTSPFLEGDTVGMQGVCVIRYGQVQVWPRSQADTSLIIETGTRYVSSTGSDPTGDGTMGNPYGTIQFAINLSGHGDVVIAFPGTYQGPGNRDIDFLGKAITVKSRDEDPTTCVINCQGTSGDPHTGFYFRTGETISSGLMGFSIIGGYGTQGSGIYIEGDDPWEGTTEASPIIRRCNIEGNFGGGVEVKGYYASPNFYDCRFNGNQGDGVYLKYNVSVNFSLCQFNDNQGYGFRGSSYGGSSFVDCEFADNDSTGLKEHYTDHHVYVTRCRITGNGGSGVDFSGDERVIFVEDSDILDNAAWGIISRGDYDGVQADNCRINDNGLDGIRSSNQTYNMVVTNSEIVGNGEWGINITRGDYVGPSKAAPWEPYGPDQIVDSVISRNGNGGIGGAPNVHYSENRILIDGCLINENEGYGIQLLYPDPGDADLAHLTVTGTTIVRNDGLGLYSEADSLTLGNTLITDNGAAAVGLGTAVYLHVACNDLFGNGGGGDWIGPVAGYEGVNGNMSGNPYFCRDNDPLNPYTLDENSPCSVDLSGCGQIGAFGVNCDYVSEVAIPDGHQPSVDRLLTNYPNPFNPWTTISFDLKGTARVDLVVYDLAGRRLARLAGERFPAGRHQVRWDGRDETGKPVSSGVYFYRIVAGEYTATKRMVMIK